MVNETIVAHATAPGESAVAITRLSGPDALAIAARHFRGRLSPLSSSSHRILFGAFVGSDGAPIDSILLSIFRAPNSYTGEDVVEVSSHGGPVIPGVVLETLVRAGARPARPGEFTERAYRNGKLDLAQAESVAALVRARSDRSLRAALSALGGSLSRRMEDLDREMVSIQSEVESRIDFPADVDEALDGTWLAGRCAALASVLREWIGGFEGTRRLRNGLRAALVGKPNVGKSSLLNALLGFDRAIVDGAPGTTRDTVEESLWFDGVEIRIVDTAGVRGSGDAVERLGVERSARAARDCDVAVLVLDRSGAVGEEDREAASLVSERPVIVAWNKADLPARWAVGSAPLPSASVLAEVETIAVRPGGVEPLRAAIRSSLPRVLVHHAGEELATTSARQEALLEDALAAMTRAEAGLREDRSYDLVAVDLGDARRALGEIVGRGVDDRVVAEIFSRFCIGK